MMGTDPLRLGTRRSQLAMAQANLVATQLTELSGRPVRLVPMSTAGDESSAPIDRLGVTGVFVAALRDALLRGEVDFLVHSYKDLPSAEVDGLHVAAVPVRDDPRDALVWRGGVGGLDDLPPGCRVATGAPRRTAQLLARWPALRVQPLRGNVDTRLRRVHEGDVDAVVLAMAGLRRLARDSVVSAVLPPEVMLPAPTQGALAVECRTDNPALTALLAQLDDPPSRTASTAERAFLRTLDAGCGAAVAAFAQAADDPDGTPWLRLDGLVASPDGSTVLRRSVTGAAARAAALGEELARQLLDAGGRTLLEASTDTLTPVPSTAPRK